MSVSLQTKNPNPFLVVPLQSIQRKDLALAGGKGANLGELIRAGFEVPPGFVITTAAYDLLLQANNLQAPIQEMLSGLQAGNPASATAVGGQIRNTIEQASLPEGITDEVLDAYRRLGGGAVAVRSSATAEDLPEAAFAGQQETFLNVVGEPALLNAIRACWASLWSERAILYRARQHVDQASVKLAVVVQKMVSADAAGVMFTADPVSGSRDELLIAANPGLGEAVVGGLVTPDQFIVEKRNGRIKHQSIGKREVVIRSKVGGGTESIKPTAIAIDPALSLSAVHGLANLGIRIERHYGAPQDIEWAWVADGSKAGRFYILQARPMTALPQPLKVSGPMRMVIPMLAEMWPVRPYPLDVTTFTGTVEGAIGNLLVAMIGNGAPDPNGALVEEDGVVARFELPALHPSPAMLLTPWITLWGTRRYDPARWKADPLIDQVLRDARELEKRDIHALTWKQNIELLHESLALIPRAMQLRERYIPKTLVGLGILWLLLAMVGRKDRLGRLIAGVETKTTETNRALESLAAQIRNDPALGDLVARSEATGLHSALEQSQSGEEFLRSFSAFLAEYGHRETSLTISQPAWRDQPQLVLGILKVLAGSVPQEPESYQEWKRTRDELLANTVLGRWPFRPAFLKSLTDARCLIQIREDTHFYATLTQPLVRRVSLELGNRLAGIGALDANTDIFHLKLDELEALGEPSAPSEEAAARIRAAVAERKAKRESLANRPLIDPRLLAPSARTAIDQSAMLSGVAGSPGIASGPACVVHDMSGFGKLQAGDVLVAPLTNPAWTPLFQRAAAVVVDTGGAASHAAIVAREYGVPAVMGTMNGTSQLRDGQWVRVDGSRGLVFEAKRTE